MDETLNEMDRIRGVFFGQLIGDALGARYEFKTAQEVVQMIQNDRQKDSFLPILGGGPFNMKPGQVTDDSEMALSLVDSLIRNKGFKQSDVAKSYVKWYESRPPDIGITTATALKDNRELLEENKETEILERIFKNVKKHNGESLSNGHLMRQSPLAIAFRNDTALMLDAAEKDTRLTHLQQTAIDASAIYLLAIVGLIKGKSPQKVFAQLLDHSISLRNPVILGLLTAAGTHAVPVKLPNGSETDGFTSKIGYLGVALQLAFHELIHANSFERGLENVISRGGDTDTNGCIAASLLGARFGFSGIPQRWIEAVKSSKPRNAALTFLNLQDAEQTIQSLASLS
uniref:ADP-ribosylglycohydrolase n=1 Tax=Panagrolaimus sp. JU765 TaxID=591449 RepID=A0AC34QNI3_9BILA